jgi:hypothetical protein
MLPFLLPTPKEGARRNIITPFLSFSKPFLKNFASQRNPDREKT